MDSGDSGDFISRRNTGSTTESRVIGVSNPHSQALAPPARAIIFSSPSAPTAVLTQNHETDRMTYLSWRKFWTAWLLLGSRLIKSTIQVQQQGRQRPGNFAPACRSGLRCA